jgi:hypothetical protein
MASSRTAIFMLLGLLIGAVLLAVLSNAGAPATTPSPATPAPSPRETDVTTVMPVPVRGVLGPVANAQVIAGELEGALVSSMSDADVTANSACPVVLLVFDSPGGMLAAAPALSDLIEHDLAPKARVVAHIRRASSAAALVALTATELTFDPAASLGHALTTDADPLTGRSRVLSPAEEAVALRVGDIVSDRGGHPLQLVLAMQSPTGLSYAASAADAHGTPELIFANDASLPTVIARVGEFVTLNAETALAIGVSSATLDLTPLLGPRTAPASGENTDASRAAANARQALAGVLGVDRVRFEFGPWRRLNTQLDARAARLDEAQQAVNRLAAALRALDDPQQPDFIAAAAVARRQLSELRTMTADRPALAAYFDLSPERFVALRKRIDLADPSAPLHDVDPSRDPSGR